MQTAIGYIRVSTASQAVEGVSLSSQESKVAAYCEVNGLELVEIVRDEGVSAKSLAGRPNARQLLQNAASNGHSIVVYKLDRMFRNTIEALTTIQALDAKGVTFHSISEKLDTSSAMGRFFVTMLAALAELERSVVSERTSDVLQNRKSQGFRIGTLPYGWRLAEDTKSLILCATEQKNLKFMQDRKSQGATYQQIASDLEDLGVKTRKGGKLKKQNIFQILKNAPRHEVLRS